MGFLKIELIKGAKLNIKNINRRKRNIFYYQ